MQVILDEQEAWSFMTLIVAEVLDQVELSDDGSTAIRDWRSGLVEGNAPMSAFTANMNAVFGNRIAEELDKVVRRRDYYRNRGD